MMAKVVPKIGLFFCAGGNGLDRTVNFNALTEKFVKARSVARCEIVNDLWEVTFLESVKNDVESGRIDRILWVGRFTPDQTEWIKSELAGTGLNAYLQEWCDLEEQGIGIEGTDPAILERKAESVIQMSLARTRLLVLLVPEELPASDALLIIGAGVAGIHTAASVAALGKRVHLVERQSGVGGKVALLSRFYPLLCDPRCGLQFALDKLLRSDLVEIHTLSEVVSLDGGPGNFETRMKKRPRYVNEHRCNACGACTTACPVEAPVSAEHASGTSADHLVSESIGKLFQPKHKAIHPALPMPFPAGFVVDRDRCPPGCTECEKACPTQAVDLNQSQSEQILRVGAVLVTTGWDPYPLSRVTEFGYQRYPRIISNLEMEQLLGTDLLGAGPLKELSLPSLKEIGFVQCAGSRDERHLPYCSSVCCSATLKQAVRIKEIDPEANCYVFCIDVRSPGFDEDLYRRARSMGVIFNRELPSRVFLDPATGKLKVAAIDPTLNAPMDVNLDLLVLAGGMTPSQGTSDMAQVLNLPQNSYGFFESHYQCHPEESQRTGVYVAGCAREPMRVSQAIESGHLAAMKALRFLEGSVSIEPTYPVVNKTKCDQCKRCVQDCPFSSFVFDEKGFPTPDLARCRQCGNCMGLCPLAAVSLGHNTIKQTAAMVGAVNPSFMGDNEPTILAFLCQNDAYKAAREAVYKELAVPPNVILMKVLCAGTVNSALVADALSNGVDGVLVGGCRDGQCHYVKGNRLVQKRSGDLSDKLKSMMINPARVRFANLEIRDSRKYVELLQSYIAELKTMGTNPFKI